MRSNKRHRLLCFVFLRKFLRLSMNIYVNWSRKVTWKWGPVMETGMSTSNVKLCVGGSPVKQNPPSPLPPKSTNLQLSPLSALNCTFSKVKYPLHQHSKSNTARLELDHNSTAEETALCITANSPHIRSCFKNTGKSSETHLSQPRYGSLSVFPKEANMWQIITHWMKRRMKQTEKDGLRYSEPTTEVASGGTGRSVTSKTLPSVALLQTDSGKWLREPCPCWRPPFKTSRVGSQASWQTYLALAGKPGELLAPASQICTFSNEMRWLPGCSSPTFAWKARKRMQRKRTTKQPANCTLGCPVLGWLFFSHERIWLNLAQSPLKTDRKLHLAVSETP